MPVHRSVTNSLNPFYSPQQVTAKGFAPLLQFAYTAKLVLSRENIHEVIFCADFLGVHNLEDSCLRFLQAQLQNDSQHASNGKVEYADDSVAEETVFCEETSSDEATQQTNHVARTEPLPNDIILCPKYRKYQYQVCDNKHNGEKHHGGDYVISTNHTSHSPVGSQLAPPRNLLSPSRIKEEPFVLEGGDERNGYNPEFGTEEVLEMELEVEGVPLAAEHSPSRDSPSSCLRSYLQRGGRDLGAVPSATIQQLLTNRLSLNHYKELVKDRQRDKAEPKAGVADVTDVARNTERAASSKHEGELDRRTVIFSAGERQVSACSYMDDTFREKLSTLMQVEAPSSAQSSLTTSCPVPIKTRANSPSCCDTQTHMPSSQSSFSHLEDAGTCSSPSSLPQLDFSSSPHSGSISGLSHCLVGVVEERKTHGAELVLSQGFTKIKSEQAFGASGGNSSDESGSFSEGDSESGVSRVSGPEVNMSNQTQVTVRTHTTV